MRLSCAMLIAAIASTSLLAQSSPNLAATSQPSQPPMHAGMPNQSMRPVDLTAMRIQLNHKLAAELQEMQFKLNQMKVNAAKTKDPAVKKQLLLETELWELTLNHFNDMTSAMLQMQQPPANPSSAAQMYRRQMMQRNMTGASAAPAPAAATTQPGVVDHP